MVQTITLAAGSAAQTSVSLVTLPTAPALRSIEPGAFDAVSSLPSPWTGQTQTQWWPGGERWSAKCTLPPLIFVAHVDAWEAWMLQMRGMLCAVQLCFPNKKAPRGVATGVPVVDGSVATNNMFMATQLFTKGWTPNTPNLLLPNDALQIGYRYYRVLDVAASDANGNAVLDIWPSLREQPPDGTPIVLQSPKVLMRFPKNQRTWSLRLPMVMDLSFDLTEYR